VKPAPSPANTSGTSKLILGECRWKRLYSRTLGLPKTRTAKETAHPHATHFCNTRHRFICSTVQSTRTLSAPPRLAGRCDDSLRCICFGEGNTRKRMHQWWPRWFQTELNEHEPLFRRCAGACGDSYRPLPSDRVSVTLTTCGARAGVLKRLVTLVGVTGVAFKPIFANAAQ